MYFNESWHISVSGPFLVSRINPQKIVINTFKDSVIQSLKSGKHEKVASFPCRGRENLRIHSWYSLSDLKHDQKRFIRIPSLNGPEIEPSGTV